MSVIVSNVEVGPWRRELKVEVPAPEVDEEIRKVVATYRKQARIPGFRQGKVPAGLIQKRYREEIEEEVRERLMQRYWPKAQEEAGLDILLSPRVQTVEHDGPGAPLSFVAAVEVRPTIELGDIARFDLPEIPVEPGDEEVEAALIDLRRSWGTWSETGRPAARGDRVRGHLIVEGEEPEVAGGEDGEKKSEEEKAPAGRPVQFEIGHSEVWEELTLAVTGTTAGREVEFTRVEEAAEGGVEERRYRLRVEVVEEIETPELDDEFAGRVGGFETAADLEKKVREEIRRTKKNQARREREKALLGQLRQRHPMELPAWVVEEEIRKMLTDYAEELARQGVDVENAPIDWESIRGQARPGAEQRVHDRLLLDAIATREEIQVKDEDVEAFVAAIARSQRRPAPLLRRELAEAGKLDLLRAQMRREQTIGHLLGEPGQRDLKTPPDVGEDEEHPEQASDSE